MSKKVQNLLKKMKIKIYFNESSFVLLIGALNPRFILFLRAPLSDFLFENFKTRETETEFSDIFERNIFLFILVFFYNNI